MRGFRRFALLLILLVVLRVLNVFPQGPPSISSIDLKVITSFDYLGQFSKFCGLFIDRLEISTHHAMHSAII